MIHSRRAWCLLIACVAGVPALAQNFPTQPVRIVIPYAPGGGSDILARPMAPELTERLAQPVVIENKGGAAGNIGTQAAANAAADGTRC